MVNILGPAENEIAVEKYDNSFSVGISRIDIIGTQSVLYVAAL
jgi:hypothetical protein